MYVKDKGYSNRDTKDKNLLLFTMFQEMKNQHKQDSFDMFLLINKLKLTSKVSI